MIEATDDRKFADLDLEEPLTEPMAEMYVGRTCFKTGPPRRVGVELEWIVRDADAPQAPVPAERTRAALGGLFCPAPPDPSAPPGNGTLHGRLSTEPGGQLELSSPPAPLAECLRDTAADVTRLRSLLAADRLTLLGVGLDPDRPPVRWTDEPRYVAMERHFDRGGPAGRVMMCSTAAVQVCVDAGADDADVRDRWDTLHELGPLLVALFANSPLHGGRPTGWRCTRQAVWSRIDPSRTRPPADRDPPPTRPPARRAGSGDPRETYARYALDAQLLAVRRPAGARWDAPAGLTFRGWLRGDAGDRLPAPTLADLDYHLTTLFPPVRPRGHLELRVIDAQPADRWQLVTALVTALLDDPTARTWARAAVAPVADAWARAARRGLADVGLARAGVDVLAAAIGAMRRAGLAGELIAAVEDFADHYPARGRSPADDVLDAWARREHRTPTDSRHSHARLADEGIVR
jgi:glutamate--cysteine ligase